MYWNQKDLFLVPEKYLVSWCPHWWLCKLEYSCQQDMFSTSTENAFSIISCRSGECNRIWNDHMVWEPSRFKNQGYCIWFRLQWKSAVRKMAFICSRSLTSACSNILSICGSYADCIFVKAAAVQTRSEKCGKAAHDHIISCRKGFSLCFPV